jgi:hypothetical protein
MINNILTTCSRLLHRPDGTILASQPWPNTIGSMLLLIDAIVGQYQLLVERYCWSMLLSAIPLLVNVIVDR